MKPSGGSAAWLFQNQADRLRVFSRSAPSVGENRFILTDRIYENCDGSAVSGSDGAKTGTD